MKKSDEKSIINIKRMIIVAFFFSGACGLIYEITWVRMLGLIFGNTTYAISTVLAAFMGGLGLGSWYFGRRIDREPNTLRFFAILEMGIGAYCISTPVLFKLAEWLYLSLTSGITEITLISVVLRFIVSFIIILVPTALMGGTLPVLARFFVRSKKDVGRNVGILYSVNTWGAVLGSFVTAFILIELLGVRGTLYLAAAINIVIGAIVFVVSKSAPSLSEMAGANQVKAERAGQAGSLPVLVLIGIGVSGFTALAYEVTWTRVFSMILGSSVYAFSIILMAFLSGIALGSLVIARFLKKNINTVSLFGIIQAIIGISALLLIPIMGLLPLTFLKLFKTYNQSFNGFQFIQFLMCLGIMIIPTTLFGAALPIAGKIYSNELKNVGRSIGSVYAANAVGTILGSILSGFVLIPLIGLQRTITFIAMVNVTLAIVFISSGFKGKKLVKVITSFFLLLFTFSCAIAIPSWNKNIIASGIYQYASEYIEKSDPIPGKEKETWKRMMEEDKEILFYKEGTNFSVAVNKHRGGTIGLSIDGKTDASNDYKSDMITQLLLGHLPILLHPDPENVLVIGLASGVTLGAVTQWGDIKEIDCVELEPAMIEASHYFDEWNNNPLADKRVKVIMNDARNYLSIVEKKYDVIISEPSNPWIAGCTPLFSKEYFELAKSQLKDNGVFCGWLQIYNLEPVDYRTIINTIKSVFPHVSIWNAEKKDTLIIATPEKLSIDYPKFKERFISVKTGLEKIRLSKPFDLLTRFIMIPDFPLTKLNTDNNSTIEFTAGRNARNPHASSRTYRMLFENIEPISNYLINFVDYVNLAKVYLDKGASVSEEKILNTELLPEDSAEYYNLLGFARIRQQEYGKAIAALSRAISMKKEYVDAYVNLAEVYFKQKNYRNAANAIDKALGIDPDYAGAYNLKGLMWIAEGKYDMALKSFEKAQKLDPTFLQPYINQAIVYMDYMNEYQAAGSPLMEALNIVPQSGEIHFHSGRASLKLESFGRAVDLFSKAMFYDKDYAAADTHYYRGVAFEGMKLIDNAMSDYNRAIVLNPEHSNAYVNRGMVYGKKGYLDKAIEDFNKAIEANPKNREAYYSRGYGYQITKHYDKAIDDYTKVISFNPDYVKPYKSRASVYREIGRHDLAKQDEEKAKALQRK